VLREIFQRALPGHTLAETTLLSGGLSNTLYRVRVRDLADSFVLRIYTRDPAACRKEIDLHRLVRGTVPVPEIVHAEADGALPHVVMRWVEGPTFRELKQQHDEGVIAGAAFAIGKTLAAIGTFSFPRPGRFEPGLEIGAPYGSLEQFVEHCLETPTTRARLAPQVCERIRNYVRDWTPRLREFDGDRSLVHSDFGSPNLVMQYAAGCWHVAAVLDWEFAFAGTPLVDLGHMMRYERRTSPRLEPHFSRGFRDAGGVLPDDWFDCGRVFDLTALLEFLTRPALPESVAPEIVRLVMATL